MTIASEINRVKYISEDFQTYRSEADAFFKEQYGTDVYNNLIATDLGNALMDQLAFAMQSISFMINRRASELFLSTARLNKSITKLARMLGYAIRPASPSIADFRITLSEAQTFPVTIPTGFQIQGPGDLIYEYLDQPYVFAPGDTTSPALTPTPLTVSEGQTKTLTFVSDGTENQQFSLYGIPSGRYIYSQNFTVLIDGVEWIRKDFIPYQADTFYEVLFTEDPPKLRFGDGIAGLIPPVNSQISVTFRYGKGASGGIASNALTKPVQPLVINGITIKMTLENRVATVGENPEDIRHVRTYASSFFRTQNAAVIKTDYDSIAQLESGVGLADAQIVRGVSGELALADMFDRVELGVFGAEFALSNISQSSISGTQTLGISNVSGVGVSGSGSLGVNGTSNLGVSGTSALGVGNKSYLGVSGTNYLGISGSTITGINYLGVSGANNLTVSGTGSLGVSGISSLSVSGTGSLGVSGLTALSVTGQQALGLSGLEMFVSHATSGLQYVTDASSDLHGYLSEILSDTSQANHVQMVLLGLDSNAKYVAPTTELITTVQSKLDLLKDAVVTINVVDGSSKVVHIDVDVEMGISRTAVVNTVESNARQALINATEPYGLLVRRSAGVNLFRSEIIEAVRDANTDGDLVFINAQITYHSEGSLDSAGNLMVGKQQIIQYRNVSVRVTKRLLINGEFVDTE